MLRKVILVLLALSLVWSAPLLAQEKADPLAAQSDFSGQGFRF